MLQGTDSDATFHGHPFQRALHKHTSHATENGVMTILMHSSAGGCVCDTHLAPSLEAVRVR